MDLANFQALLTPADQEVLAEAVALQPREASFLPLFTALSRKYPADLARAALEIAILRGEATTKFPQAGKMYFTRPALEQASSFIISSYRAERYGPFKRIADLGCSIGGDTLAFANNSVVTGIDMDPLRLRMAQANLAALGLAEQADFIQTDLQAGLPLKSDPTLALFFDPARRTAIGRVFSVKDYQPPLEVALDWLERFPALGVKISPGVDISELQPYPAEIEFISLNGELKETVLWFGPLRNTRRRATLLPGQHTLVSASEFPALSVGTESQRIPLSDPRAYIYEPDPAILRAGLVEDLGIQIGAAQLDPDIAYLTKAEMIETPFARHWEIEAWFPFQLKRLRQELRARHVGHVTVKKRGSPLQPEELITQLKLSGEEERVIFLTHLRGKPIVIIAFKP